MKQRRSRTLGRAWLAVVPTSLVLAACGSATTDPGDEQAHSRWQSQRPTSYTFDLTTQAMVGEAVSRMTVVDGRATEAVSLKADHPTSREHAVTLDDLWHQLAEDEHRADSVRVSYDPVWGFPSSVWVDEDLHSVDDEHSYSVSGFQVT